MSSIPFKSFVPLFGRLSETTLDASPSATPGVRTSLDLPGLKTSVLGELTTLLSTRSPLSFAEFARSERAVLDYGIPDTSALSMDSVDDRKILQAAIARAIALFEPRLIDVTVAVHASATRGADAQVTVAGSLRADPHRAPVSFVLRANDTRPEAEARGQGGVL